MNFQGDSSWEIDQIESDNPASIAGVHWVPKLNLEEKNQTGLEGFEMFREEFGLEYVTEVEMDETTGERS